MLKLLTEGGCNLHSFISAGALVSCSWQPCMPRAGCLFAYRSEETAYGTPPSPGREVPPLWAMRAAQGKLPRRLTELLKGTGVFYPHWAKEAYTSA
jgi:hypothetical protein